MNMKNVQEVSATFSMKQKSEKNWLQVMLSPLNDFINRFYVFFLTTAAIIRH